MHILETTDIINGITQLLIDNGYTNIRHADTTLDLIQYDAVIYFTGKHRLFAIGLHQYQQLIQTVTFANNDNHHYMTHFEHFQGDLAAEYGCEHDENGKLPHRDTISNCWYMYGAHRIDLTLQQTENPQSLHNTIAALALADRQHIPEIY